MESRRQGTICLVVGLVSLGTFLLLDRDLGAQVAGQRSQSLATWRNAASLPTEVYGTRQELQGRCVNHGVDGESHFWVNVEILRLPYGEHEVRPVIVYERKIRQTAWSWLDPPPGAIERSYVVWQDREGQLVDQAIHHNCALSQDALDLVIAHPHSDEEGNATWRGPSGALHRFMPSDLRTSSATNKLGSVGYYLNEASLEMRAWGLRRDVELCLQEKMEYVRSLNVSARRETLRTDDRVELSLNTTAFTPLTRGESAELGRELADWRNEYQASQQIVRFASAGTLSFDDFDQMSSERQDRNDSLSREIYQPAIKQTVTSTLIEPGVPIYRVRASLEIMQKLELSRPIHWTATTTSGQELCGESTRGRVLVMAFTHLDLEETASILSAMSKLRELHGECVEPILFATDHQESERQSLASITEGYMPVVDGSQVATELGIFNGGVPSVLVVDREGVPRFLHAWQTLSDFDQLNGQVTALATKTPQTQIAWGVRDTVESLLVKRHCNHYFLAQ